MIEINSDDGRLEVVADEPLDGRPAMEIDLHDSHHGMGRELFRTFRNNVSAAEAGATIFGE